MATVAPALLRLRAQIDEVWPRRLRVSDGDIGDASHQARRSDHNDGNAIDITLDTQNGPNLDLLAELLFQDSRTHYVIWCERIANARFDQGAWRPYTAPPGAPLNRHTRHLHLSIHPEMRDDASDWPNGKATGWDAQGGMA